MSAKTKNQVKTASLVSALYLACIAPMIGAIAWISYATPIIQAAVRH